MVKNAATAAILAALLAGCRSGPPVPPGFQGLVEYDDRVLSFEVAGRVDAVPAKRGDDVVAGQVLAHLDDTMEKLTCDARRKDAAAAAADLALLEAGNRREDIASLADDVSSAQSNEELQRTNAQRTRALYADGALPKADLDRAESELQRAELQRKSLEQRLSALRKGARPQEIARAHARLDESNAQVALEEELVARHTLKADTAGEVVDVTVKTGELAAVGTAAFIVADTHHPYVDVFVPEGELGTVHAGAKAEVRVDASSAPLAATIEHVSPETEFTPKFLFSDRERPHLVVRVRVRVDDPERRLHAGVPAFARVTP
ncbi:MAG TPA: HlyD family efflux transporter periplasmic adaptor subunit [Polyangiaceae bacterium]|jgi:HlyD family secretion protein